MKKIVSVVIKLPAPFDISVLPVFMDPYAGKATVTATYDDGSQGICLGYYADELRFTESDFTELTDQDVGDLHHRRDVAYLQS